MIETFGNELTELIYNHDPIPRKLAKKFPGELVKKAVILLDIVENATCLEDFYFPPSMRFERLEGKLKEFYSIRINDQWRIMFQFENGNAYEVQIIDYHKK